MSTENRNKSIMIFIGNGSYVEKRMANPIESKNKNKVKVMFLTHIAVGVFQEAGTFDKINVILVEYQWSSH